MPPSYFWSLKFSVDITLAITFLCIIPNYFRTRLKFPWKLWTIIENVQLRNVMQIITSESLFSVINISSQTTCLVLLLKKSFSITFSQKRVLSNLMRLFYYFSSMILESGDPKHLTKYLEDLDRLFYYQKSGATSNENYCILSTLLYLLYKLGN